MRFARIVFLVAGIYGVLVLTPMYFLENTIGQQTPPAITHPEYFYGFIGVGLAWQFLFLLLSTDPLKYRAMILPSIVEKITFGIAVLILLRQGRVAMSTLGFGSIDWILAILFSVAYFKTKPENAGA
ncbi:MAG: hypothetical protein LAO19_05785 [Acidobacteriia bacterium]|nr:hypothetical protein [Terriglobia bacterium]